MTKANFIRKGGGLVPADDMAAEILSKINQGKEITLDVKINRNPRHHRLFFALLNEICESGAWDDGVDSLLDWVKIKNRHIEPVEISGKTLVRLKSISFETMTQDKFTEFFDRSICHICSELLGDIDWQEFRDDFLERVEGPYRDSRAA